MIVIIPSRYDSVRLPGKPLIDINGKPLIEHVYNCAQDSNAERIIVATDDERISSAVKDFGGEAVMTSNQHQSGTDRINEVIDVLSIKDNEIIINLQGDEPLMPAALISQVASLLENNPDYPMATACHRITEQEEFKNPNLVKVVFDENDCALYFSRAPIPWQAANQKSTPATFGYGHIGIYGYRAGFIKQYSQWPVVGIEKSEKLEQLRALYHDIKIKVCVVDKLPGPGVDTPEDLAVVKKVLAS